MHSAAIVASLLLGAMFLTAAVSKLRAPERWRAGAAELGLVRPLVAVMPYVEAVLGASLLVQPRAAAIVAIVLLASMTGLIVVRLAQGRRPACACFGSLSTRPIGVGTVLRNVAFIAVAVVAASG